MTVLLLLMWYVIPIFCNCNPETKVMQDSYQGNTSSDQLDRSANGSNIQMQDKKDEVRCNNMVYNSINYGYIYIFVETNIFFSH